MINIQFCVNHLAKNLFVSSPTKCTNAKKRNLNISIIIYLDFIVVHTNVVCRL